MARYFDGTNGLEAFGATPITARPASFFCWCRDVDEEGGANVSLYPDSNTSNSVGLNHVNQFSTERGTFFTENNSFEATSSGSGQWKPGTWNFMGGVASTTAQGLYVNGFETLGGASKNYQQINNISVGIDRNSAASSAANGMVGDMAHVAIWDVALTAYEFDLMRNNVLSPLFIQPGRLRFYAPMLEHSGPVRDIMGGITLRETLGAVAPCDDVPGMVYPEVGRYPELDQMLLRHRRTILLDSGPPPPTGLPPKMFMESNLGGVTPIDGGLIN